MIQKRSFIISVFSADPFNRKKGRSGHEISQQQFELVVGHHLTFLGLSAACRDKI